GGTDVPGGRYLVRIYLGCGKARPYSGRIFAIFAPEDAKFEGTPAFAGMTRGTCSRTRARSAAGRFRKIVSRTLRRELVRRLIAADRVRDIQLGFPGASRKWVSDPDRSSRAHPNSKRRHCLMCRAATAATGGRAPNWDAGQALGFGFIRLRRMPKA